MNTSTSPLLGLSRMGSQIFEEIPNEFLPFELDDALESFRAEPPSVVEERRELEKIYSPPLPELLEHSLSESAHSEADHHQSEEEHECSSSTPAEHIMLDTKKSSASSTSLKKRDLKKKKAAPARSERIEPLVKE